MAAPHVVSVRDVCVKYGSNAVLDHVNVEIPEGDFVGIVGPNGSGKSSLLKTMLGLVAPHCGEARLFGTPVKRFREWPRVGYVPQNVVHVDAQLPATAFEVALLGRVGRRGLLRRLTKEDRAATMQAMREVGVDHLVDRRIGTLSGGQRQRVFLAKALAQEPDVLILDEPTTGVDPRAREEFFHLLDHLNHDHGMTLVLVSHDTQAITLSAHRLVAINRTVVFDGTPEEFEASGGFGAAYDIHLHHGQGESHRSPTHQEGSP